MLQRTSLFVWTAVAFVIGVVVTKIVDIAFDAALAEKLSEWLNTPAAGEIFSKVFSWPVLAALLLVVGALIIVDRRRSSQKTWRTWCEQFRQAVPAKDLDLSHVVKNRPMGQTFVPAPRALRLPPTLQRLDEPESADLTSNAEDYLKQRVGRYTRDLQNRERVGLLIQGRELTGKTRFVSEWLRKHRPETLVLVPDDDSQKITYLPRLQDWKDEGICLFLDDLDVYKPQAAALADFIAEAQREKVPLFVLATVRDGGPAISVQTDPSFQRLRENLETLDLVAPTFEHLRDVQEKNEGEEHAEARSFGFLIGRELEEARRRYEHDLTPEARILLQAARLLDDRSISLERLRWFSVAERVLSFPDAPADDAFRNLIQLGFLERGFPEPARLKNVVPLPIAHNLDAELENVFSDRKRRNCVLRMGHARGHQRCRPRKGEFIASQSDCRIGRTQNA